MLYDMLKTARDRFLIVADVFALCSPSDTLSTKPPLRNNTLASGFVNFTVQACFDVPPNAQCSWRHKSFDEVFYTAFLGCSPNETNFYSIKCSEDNKVVDTSFILHAPVLKGSNVFTMMCRISGLQNKSNHIAISVQCKQV